MSKKKQRESSSDNSQARAKKPAGAATKRTGSRSLKKVTMHNVTVLRGQGGETHSAKSERSSTLTTAQGMPVADNQNSLTQGERGPVLLEDAILREKIFRFDHERIPERVVHARGYGAKGYFELTDSLAKVSSAKLFQTVGERCDVFVRFSTVVGNRGSADLVRDARGFAVKFYTPEGNWDLVGNNIPVFFIQDAMKFPDLIHAAKQEPDRGFPQAQSAHDNFWDFVSLMPEAMHMLMWTMSDRGIPRSFRTMEGFGVHTFRLVNSRGKSTYVKFHWKPKAGLQSVVWNEAVKINGADPDYHRRDLWNSIESGQFPEWELGVQLFDDKFADKFEFDILDATKLIPEEQIPVRTIGRMVLNKNVDNFFAETEQVAFCTQNLVPGIDHTNDPLLQGRNFSYLDTQLKRLGSPNFTELPVNAPRCPMAHLYQDGHMASTIPTGRANYEPNSWTEHSSPSEDPDTGFMSATIEASGDKRRIRPSSFADHYSQARQFYRSQTAIEQQHIADAIVFELSKVDRVDIRERTVASLINVDSGLAQQVANGLGFKKLPKALTPAASPRDDLPISDALSIQKSKIGSLAGKVLGILVAHGCDAATLANVQTHAEKAGATCKLIALTRHGITDSEGTLLEIDEKINGGPSVLFDVVILAMSETGITALLDEPTAHDFVSDAWNHCKFIGHVGPVDQLFSAAGVNHWDEDDAVIPIDTSAASTKAFLANCQVLRHWDRHS